MIFRLGLTAANFDPTQCDDLVATHNRVMDLWLDHGLMAKPSAEEVERLPESLRKRWRKSLQRLPSFSCPTTVDLAAAKSQSAAREAAADGALNLGCLSDAEWRQLGLPDGPAPVKPTAPGHQTDPRAICRTAHCDQVQFVKQAKRLATSPVQVGTTPAKLWEERFTRLTSNCATTVVIVDRYSLKPDFRAQQASEFVMRRLLDGLNSSCSVQWFTHLRDGIGFEFQRLLSFWNEAGRQGSLELFSPPDDLFAMHCHHRYIRFGPWCCVLDTGIEVFSGDTTKLTAFHFRSVVEEDVKIEERLRQGGRRLFSEGRR